MEILAGKQFLLSKIFLCLAICYAYSLYEIDVCGHALGKYHSFNFVQIPGEHTAQADVCSASEAFSTSTLAGTHLYMYPWMKRSNYTRSRASC